MSDRTKIILGVAIFTAFIAGLSWFFFGGTSEVTDTQNSGGGLFPEGEGTTLQGTPQRPPSGGIISPATSGDSPLGAFVPAYKKLTQEAVAGAVSIGTKGAPKVRYVAKTNGHIFDTDIDQLEPTRISNMTIAHIYDAIWSPAGNFVGLRYFKSGNEPQAIGFVIAGGSTTDSATLQNRAFPTTMSEFVVSPSKNNFFYLNSVDRTMQGVLTTTENKTSKIVFNSIMDEWILGWPNEDVITLQTKAAADIPGYFYSLDPKTGRQDRLLGDISGLTALLSPDKKKILYSEGVGTALRTSMFDLLTGETSAFPTDTLPEKCIWSKKDVEIVYCAVSDVLPSTVYPDGWYQGLFFFRDAIWKIYLDTNEVEVIFDPAAEGEQPIDATNLQLSASEDALYFTNKRDGTLWYVKVR